MLRDPSLIPLSRQHQHGLALCVMTERGLASDSSHTAIATYARKAVDHYNIELVNHFGLEERVVFPAVAGHPLVPELIGEHRKLEALIAGLREDPSESLLREFVALLRNHIRREENVLFEDIPKEVPREILDSMGSEIEAKVVRVCL
jgi:hemerythrin-like domain-containing protein